MIPKIWREKFADRQHYRQQNHFEILPSLFLFWSKFTIFLFLLLTWSVSTSSTLFWTIITLELIQQKMTSPKLKIKTVNKCLRYYLSLSRILGPTKNLSRRFFSQKLYRKSLRLWKLILTLSLRRSISYRNKFKSMDWFL